MGSNNPICTHVSALGKNRFDYPVSSKQVSNFGSAVRERQKECPDCHAIYVDRQLGLESIADCLGWATNQYCEQCFICGLLGVFRELWRVLKDDGTCWLNIGDSYAGSNKGYGGNGQWHGGPKQKTNAGSMGVIPTKAGNGLKNKDLIGIPFRISLALQKTGWYLRSDIILAKRNPMVESVKDRPTRSHEFMFLLTKNPKYYYDADAIAEPFLSPASTSRYKYAFGGKKNELLKSGDKPTALVGYRNPGKLTRNKRDVWGVTVTGSRDNHFATYNESWIEPCILAGSRVGDVVLDPFGGSGTTALVAQRLNRKLISLDLSWEYCKIAQKRISLTSRSGSILVSGNQEIPDWLKQ